MRTCAIAFRERQQTRAPAESNFSSDFIGGAHYS
jgi:hypothetical protein